MVQVAVAAEHGLRLLELRYSRRLVELGFLVVPVYQVDVGLFPPGVAPRPLVLVFDVPGKLRPLLGTQLLFVDYLEILKELHIVFHDGSILAI